MNGWPCDITPKTV